MKTRIYKTDKRLLQAQCQEVLSASETSRFHFKVFAVNMVLAGQKAADIGRMSGFSKMSVSSWVKTADEHGVDALRGKSRPGRPPRLNDLQRKDIDKALRSSPEEYGFKVWDGPSLSAYIKKAHGVKMCVRQCQRLMHALGFSLIRPQSFPSKGHEDTEKRKVYKKTGGAEIGRQRHSGL